MTTIHTTLPLSSSYEALHTWPLSRGIQHDLIETDADAEAEGMDPALRIFSVREAVAPIPRTPPWWRCGGASGCPSLI